MKPHESVPSSSISDSSQQSSQREDQPDVGATFGVFTRDMEKFVPSKKKRTLSNREETKAIRKIGACEECKRKKVKVRLVVVPSWLYHYEIFYLYWKISVLKMFSAPHPTSAQPQRHRARRYSHHHLQARWRRKMIPQATTLSPPVRSLTLPTPQRSISRISTKSWGKQARAIFRISSLNKKLTILGFINI